jgi:hypothetical protein
LEQIACIAVEQCAAGLGGQFVKRGEVAEALKFAAAPAIII